MKSALPRLLLLLWLCGLPAAAQTVSPAGEYNAMFHRTRGWTGADGTYSLTLPDGATLWCFSDTFFGRVVEGRRRDFEMVNNSLVVQDHDSLEFLEAPVFTPPDGVGWFWLWDGLPGGFGQFEMLLGQFHKFGPGMWDFEQTGLWLARFAPDRRAGKARVLEYRELPFFNKRDGVSLTFGSALMRTHAWVYVYGIRDEGLKRECLVARTPATSLGQPGTWRFFDGETWVRDMEKAKPLFVQASMEASVHRTRDGGYLYVGSVDRSHKAIVCRYASQPWGPWSAPHPVYETPETGGNVFTYNAKAHPQKTGDGHRLLISYNVNTMDTDEVVEVAGIYRPRFVWWTPPDQGWLPLSGPGR